MSGWETFVIHFTFYLELLFHYLLHSCKYEVQEPQPKFLFDSFTVRVKQSLGAKKRL